MLWVLMFIICWRFEQFDTLLCFFLLFIWVKDDFDLELYGLDNSAEVMSSRPVNLPTYMFPGQA